METRRDFPTPPGQRSLGCTPLTPYPALATIRARHGNFDIHQSLWCSTGMTHWRERTQKFTICVCGTLFVPGVPESIESYPVALPRWESRCPSG